MLSSRDYKIICVALSYMLANLDDLDDMHKELPLIDLEGEEMPTVQEMETLLNTNRNMVKKIALQELAFLRRVYDDTQIKNNE